jgi:hypothetical protein
MITCGDSGADDPPANQTSTLYEGVGNDGNTYKLKITKAPGRAAYTLQSGDDYVLTTIYPTGGTNTNSGIITVSGSGSDLLLSLSEGFSLTITISGGKITSISGSIKWSNGSSTTGTIIFASNGGGDATG